MNWILVVAAVLCLVALFVAILVVIMNPTARVGGRGNGNWLRKRQCTVTTLAVTDAIREGLDGVFQEVRRYHPEIPASDPGEEEIKRLCEAFIARLEEHVEYWNRQPSSTPEP